MGTGFGRRLASLVRRHGKTSSYVPSEADMIVAHSAGSPPETPRLRARPVYRGSGVPPVSPKGSVKGPVGEPK